MDGAERFQQLFERDAKPAHAKAGPAKAPACPPPRRPGGTLIDGLVGLAIRMSLAALLWSWARGNALSPRDWADLAAWARPEPGFVAAVGVWLPRFVDPGFVAFVILAAASLVALALAAGFLARIAGLLTVAVSAYYALFILPEAWTSALVMGALGLYLALRGAGPVSIDFAAMRLSRLG
ncbi:hypothetical protein E5163_08400 [Marinicauda algicola]|uniref:DoxX family membrane protein n=1 Tax=Marinicauda algicola TaxID=2029849 RepID=A0A4S2H0V0_9PROT|nr:hypothetical protein E5163_08400 [Marinicauda algicola]